MVAEREWEGRPAVAAITIGNALCRVAVFEQGKVEIVPLEDGERAMSSTVLLHRMREVGKYASLYSGTDPHLLVSGINRLLGRKYRESQEELRQFSCQIRNEDDRIRIADWVDRLYSSIDLYAMLLRKLRQATERFVGRAVEHTVIAVPGSFDDYQRRSVRTAAESVFTHIKLINEPTAAALYLSTTETIGKDQHLMTFDWGGGKCEVAILKRTSQGRLQISAIAGDTHLGGLDIDHQIFNHLARRFQQKYHEPLIGDSAMAKHEVMMAIRAAKHQLEFDEQAEINVPFVNFDRFGGALHLNEIISRQLLSELCDHLKKRAYELMNRCWNDANRPVLNKVILLGGTTRLQFVSALTARFAGFLPTRMENPDEMAVLGAALHSASLTGEFRGLALEDLTAHSLGITTYTGGMGFVLKRQSAIPSTTTKRFLTAINNQPEAHIEVREGEEKEAKNNRVIGEFLLPLPPRLPRSSPIDVTIGKDADGIVLVRAHDLTAGITKEIAITYDL